MSLVPRLTPDSTPWRTILSTPRALVLYNPAEHSLSVLPQNQPADRRPPDPGERLGNQREEGGSISSDRQGKVLPVRFAIEGGGPEAEGAEGGQCPACGRPYHTPNSTYFPMHEDPQAQHAHYFELLSRANTPLPSGRASPVTSSSASRIKRFFSPSASASDSEDDEGLQTEARSHQRPAQPSLAGARLDPSTSSSSAPEANGGADGYFKRFFVEKQRLGMGAYGSVFLCEHVLDGQPLGLYAVKKVAVGKDKAYRRSVLREVEVLKGLRHENIITYHHAWIEKARFSSFGPYIDSLHILMQYAPLGSLEDYLSERSGASGGPAGAGGPDVKRSGQRVEDVKAAFRSRRGGEKPTSRRERRGVRLMSKDEIDVIFGGVVRGLGYLHNHNLLHLDLKCSNILLYVDDSNGDLIPRPLISDFGTTRHVVYLPQEGEGGKRTGNTGTLEYCAPENVQIVEGRGDIGKEGDHWALGLILHKLLFFRLPYSQVEDLELLATEILAYPGFVPTSLLFESLDRRGLPRFYLWILGSLLNLDKRKRMGCRMIEDIMQFGIREEGHHHYPFDFRSQTPPEARVYEQTDTEHSLAPYVPQRGLAPDDGATVTSLEPTPNASFLDLPTVMATTSEEPKPRSPLRESSLPSPIEEGPLRLLPFSRILPPPAKAAREQPHMMLSETVADLAHAAVVLFKFLSLHLILARPTLGAQIAILALALASRGPNVTQSFGLAGHLFLIGALWTWSR